MNRQQGISPTGSPTSVHSIVISHEETANMSGEVFKVYKEVFDDNSEPTEEGENEP